MGCDTSRQEFIYSVLPKEEKDLVKDGIGPYFNTQYPDYEKQCELYKNCTWIEHLNQVINKNGDSKMFGYRKNPKLKEFEDSHTYLTYSEVDKYADNFAYHMNEKKLVETKTYDYEGEVTFLGFFARNCVEWAIADIACQRDSVTSVTFYNTLGDESFDHIFKQTRCNTIIVSNDCIDNLIKYHQQYNFESLKNVIICDLTLYSDEEMVEKLKKAGLTVYSFKDLIATPKDEKEGEIKKPELNISKPSTLFTLCYTSGTTNLPKGVKITQNNFYSGSFAIPDSNSPMDSSTVHISYLPLAHAMERLCLHFTIGSGGLVCFIASADVKTYLKEDIALTKPTVLVAVPRVLTMFHKAITDNLKKLEGMKLNLFEKAYKAKKENFVANGELTHGLWDLVVFKKIRDSLGGNIKYFITGSAPLPMEVANDMKIFFSAPIVEAYGMTEICGAVTMTDYKDTENGMTGGCIRTCMYKLADRKEMNYHSKTVIDDQLCPSGEVCVKGLSVVSGYFLDEENTKKAFDEDGWLKTGDVGRIMPSNTGLKIIDRVKEIFKLSQGEYIAPSKLENVYIKNKFLLQICVYGNSYYSYLIAIVVPNKIEVQKYLVEKGKIKEEDQEIEKYYDDPDLKKEIIEGFNELAKVNNFNPLEKPKKIHISTTEFTVQNDLITPTMKLCRKKIENYFKADIDNLLKDE